MDRPQSVSLVRAMLALGRAGSTGVLTITAGGRRCRIEVRRGVACSATGSFGALLLGDLLQQRGEFDADAHRAALDRAQAPGPIGAWLVAHGVTSPLALERALREQLRRRVLLALGWHELSYGFTPVSAAERGDLKTPAAPEAVRATAEFDAGERSETQTGHRLEAGACVEVGSLALDSLALEAARQSLGPEEIAEWLQRQGGTRHVCSALGQRLLRSPGLFERPVLAQLLVRGATLHELATAAAASRRDLQLLAGLCWLGTLAPAADSGSSYALLLRKQRELRRRAGPAELLELRAGESSSAARRALRRLARQVHPDALGPSANPALRQVSTDLMRALIDAELQLRPTAAAKPTRG